MATTYTGDLTIYDTLINTIATERLQSNFNLFGSVTRNAIRLVSNAFLGDFLKESFVVQPTVDFNGLAIHQDGDIVYNKITQSEVVKAKFLRYVADSANLRALQQVGMSMEEWSGIVAEAFADNLTKNAIDLVIGAGLTAIGEVTDLVVDNSTAVFSYNHIIDAQQTFGDRSDRIIAMVGHSGAYSEIAKTAVGQSSLDTVAGVQIVNGSTATGGLPFIQYDSADLINTSGADPVYTVLFLTESAFTVEESGPANIRTDIDFTKQGDVVRAKHEVDWTLGLKGYSWSGTSGSSSAVITDAALKAAANWNKIATDNKNTAGAILKFKAAA